MRSLKKISIFFLIFGTIILIIGLILYYNSITYVNNRAINISANVCIMVGVIFMLGAIVDLCLSYDYDMKDLLDLVPKKNNVYYKVD